MQEYAEESVVAEAGGEAVADVQQEAQASAVEEQSMPAPGLQQGAGQTGAGVAASEIDLNALIDVQVTLSVEIGRSKMPIKQLISLNQGSVVELDRAVDEPLDLLVNGTLIARGEVVVVDGQFGLRLIDVVSQPERLRKLK